MHKKFTNKMMTEEE